MAKRPAAKRLTSISPSAPGALLARVAHELNNPLSVVVAQAAMLEELATDENLRRRSRRVRVAAERCAGIVRSVLAVARQGLPQRSAINLHDLVEDALDLARAGLRSAGISVEKEFADDLPPVWGDPDQLKQVLTNLLLNAQQVPQQAPAPHLLRLSTAFEPASQSVRLAVAASGPDLPAAIGDRIVGSFSTTKPVGWEAGIGLSACRGIVEAHGGSIAVDDAQQGGARFTVRLPARTAPVAGAPKRAKSTAAQPRHILVVDDEPEILDTLVEILEIQGHTVDAAESGASALHRITATAYDLIFSDLRMPDLDGKALFERLQQEHPELARRMVIVTGDVLNADTMRFLDTSGLICLEKPFTPEEVRLMAARRLCAGRAPAKAHKPARRGRIGKWAGEPASPSAGLKRRSRRGDPH